MRRTLPARVIAFVLALLASITAPGAAVAHGFAHHRDHHRDHHRQQHGDHEHRATHDVSPGSELPAEHPADDLAGARSTVAANPDVSHDHPVFDLSVRPRSELALALPVEDAVTVLVPVEIRVPAGMPVPHASLPRADPDAEPPPRLRGPPLR